MHLLLSSLLSKFSNRGLALFASGVMLLAVAGCKAPTPTFDPLLGAGSQRVSPPPTGSYGTPDSYYSGNVAPTNRSTAAPNATVGSGIMAQNQITPNNSLNGTPINSTWRSANGVIDSSVQNASANINQAATNLNQQVAYTQQELSQQLQQRVNNGTQYAADRIQGAVSNLNLGGMPVNDGTVGFTQANINGTPQRVLQINQLPIIGQANIATPVLQGNPPQYLNATQQQAPQLLQVPNATPITAQPSSPQLQSGWSTR